MNRIHKADKQLSGLFSRLGHREEGFSMISAIMALMVGTLLSLAAWATANSDIKFTENDKWSRLAYQRAQSGISDYVQSLAENSGYWKNCDRPDGVTSDGLGQTALNDTDIGVSDHPQRRWLPYSSAGTVDDLSYNAQYSIDLVPLTGTCKPVASSSDRMIDPTTGTFRVQVTGRAGPLVPSNLTGTAIETWRQNNWKRSTIVAEFRRNGFLDYAYFTDHEGQDPNLQSSTSGCSGYYADDPGYLSSMGLTTEPPFPGRYRYTACTEIAFGDGDKILGPFHTNDSALLSSTPSNPGTNGGTGALFGNNGKGDRIEVYDNGKVDSSVAGRGKCPFRDADADLSSATSITNNCFWDVRRGSGTTLLTGPAARYLDLPRENDDLTAYATNTGDPENQGYSYYGKTSIEMLSNGKLRIQNAIAYGTGTEELDYPSSGVIYVYNNGVSACQSDPYKKSYATSIPAGCALAEVKGDYNKSLTIGSESDIVITGNIERDNSDTAVVGLIANQYVRVRHYGGGGAQNYRNASNNCASDGIGGTAVSVIEAAILTLNRSFTVDGYNCGGNLGRLTTRGALAQRWRGTVGQGATINSAGNCSGGSGYCKDYNYDYTLKSQTPPHFLSPSAASWKIIRLRQVLPACSCKSNGT